MFVGGFDVDLTDAEVVGLLLAMRDETPITARSIYNALGQMDKMIEGDNTKQMNYVNTVRMAMGPTLIRSDDVYNDLSIRFQIEPTLASLINQMPAAQTYTA